MLDVHPPEHTPHSWRDFLIHIATIVVGLIIAVGLEQTVEYVHHHHQRAELEESLHIDTVKAIRDTEGMNRDEVKQMQRLSTRIAQVEDALDSNRPVPPPPPRPSLLDPDIPDDPAWKAAKSSGVLELLPQDELKAYSEVDSMLNSLASTDEHFHDASRRVVQIDHKYERNDAKTPDFSHARREDLEGYLDALIAYQQSLSVLNFRYRIVHGAEVAILKGDRDLSSIQHAERNSW